MFPIKSYSGHATLEYVYYYLGEPVFDVKECQVRGLTYAAPLRAKVRLVDVNTTRYAIARRYMLRLRRDDFDDNRRIEPLAAVARMSVEAFRNEFEYLVSDEPPALRLLEVGKD